MVRRIGGRWPAILVARKAGGKACGRAEMRDGLLQRRTVLRSLLLGGALAVSGGLTAGRAKRCNCATSCSGGPWPKHTTLGSRPRSVWTERRFSRGFEQKKGGGCRSPGRWVMKWILASTSPAISTRSDSRKNMTCPSVWPGAWITRKPATSSPSRKTRATGCGGPAHKRWFKVGVRQGERRLAEGSGSSKRAAERAAATVALQLPDLIAQMQDSP